MIEKIYEWGELRGTVKENGSPGQAQQLSIWRQVSEEHKGPKD